METKEIIKYVAIAAGAYLIYKVVSGMDLTAITGGGSTPKADATNPAAVAAVAAAEAEKAARAASEKALADGKTAAEAAAEALKAAQAKTAAVQAEADALKKAAAEAASKTTKSLAVTAQKLRDTAAAAGYPAYIAHTFDEWNYFYNKLTGAYGPAYEDVYTWDQGGGSRGVKMAAEQWLEGVTGAGLMGLGANISGWYGFDAVNLWRT